MTQVFMRAQRAQQSINTPSCHLKKYNASCAKINGRILCAMDRVTRPEHLPEPHLQRTEAAWAKVFIITLEFDMPQDGALKAGQHFMNRDDDGPSGGWMHYRNSMSMFVDGRVQPATSSYTLSRLVEKCGRRIHHQSIPTTPAFPQNRKSAQH